MNKRRDNDQIKELFIEIHILMLALWLGREIAA